VILCRKSPHANQEQVTEIERSGDQYCILVEGPRSGIAEFYGNWLLAASKAEAFWKQAYSEPDFAEG
jgi:hypothetical protein